MWKRLLLNILYRVVLAMPEVLLKDKNLERRSKAKRIMFNPEQVHFDFSDSKDSSK
jgi:hypothetical protein